MTPASQGDEPRLNRMKCRSQNAEIAEQWLANLGTNRVNYLAPDASALPIGCRVLYHREYPSNPRANPSAPAFPVTGPFYA